ncbi:hypothetical protein, partial [Brevibacterium sp. FAM 24638]|uniref:hypothetical protein n=1 Tax=Brevibacterium sp. FAM 24638 TaxID=3415681 RepID=UPI003C7A7C70
MGQDSGWVTHNEADTPSEHACLCGVVMGVCLWFENPIACLFEQVVMPEHLIISGETITRSGIRFILCGWFFAEPFIVVGVVGVWSFFLVNLLT